MKRRGSPHKLRAVKARGAPREPEGLRRYRTGERGMCSVLDRFPHGRFCLGLHLECPRKNTAEPEEMRVCTFYRAVLPWLRAHRLDPEDRQRCIDFVDFLDELMELEDDLYAVNTPWPLAELLRVVEAVGELLATEPHPDEDDDAEHLGAIFTACAEVLRGHAGCCRDVLVNVHWW